MPPRYRALALLAAICIAFYWRLLFTNQFTFLDSPDLAGMELPRFQFIASELRHLRFPLWDPTLWIGQPFLAQFTGAAYPLNWLLAPIKFHGGKISLALIHWLYVFIHFHGVAAACWLARELGRSWPASILAGLIFGLGAFMGVTDWPQLLNGAVWGPIAALFLIRAVNGGNATASAAISGLALGLSWLSGHHEVPIYLSFAMAALWLWHAWAQKSIAILKLAALAFTIAILVSALQTIPGIEYGQLAKRWAGASGPLAWNQVIPYFVHRQFSEIPASLIGIVVTYRSTHVSLYIGVAAASLAILGVILGWQKHPALRPFAVLAIAALLFSMAADTWFHGLLYSTIPIFAKARVPARILILFNLAVAPLAAYGFDLLRTPDATQWTRKWANALFLAAAVAYAYGVIKPEFAGSPAMFTALAALLFAIVLKAPLTGRPLATALTLLCLWELGHGIGEQPDNRNNKEQPSPLRLLLENDDIANFLRGQPGVFRINVNAEDLSHNFSQWQGIESLEGHMAGVTVNVLEMSVFLPRMQDLLNVEYAITRKQTRPGQQYVFEGASGVRVYKNPTAFPRARIVHQVDRVASHGARMQLYADPEFDLLHRSTMLTDPPKIEACDTSGEQAAIAPGRTIEAKLNCTGMVILAEASYPGWTATIDGNPATIHEVDGALRGVVVPKGDHRIDFRFHPKSVYLGVALTVLGLLLTAVLSLRPKAAKHPASPTGTPPPSSSRSTFPPPDGP